MKRTIFLVLALAAYNCKGDEPVLSGEYVEMELAPNLTLKNTLYEKGYIYGSFKPEREHYFRAPSSIASIWDIQPYPFQIIVWPPKYCHAVFVCLKTSIGYNDYSNIHVFSNWCDNALKLYPYKNELVVLKQGKIDKTYALNTFALAFRPLKDRLFNIKLQLKHVTKFSDYMKGAGKFVDFTINLQNKQIVLLTNSDQCRAHVAQSIGSGEYLPLPNVKNVKPNLFPSFVYEGNVKSFARPTYPFKMEAQRNVNYLEFLKNVFKKVTVNEDKRCFTYKSYDFSDFTNRKITSTSISSLTYSINTYVGMVLGLIEEKHFEIELNSCHWLRVGFYVDENEYRLYPARASIDFYFEEGFMLTPNLDEAIPLSGGAQFVQRIRISFFKDAATKVRFATVSYGPFGNSYSFSERFDVPVLEKVNFKVKLFRSSYCDANLVSTQQFSKYTGHIPTHQNMWGVEDCKYDEYNKT